MTPRVAETVDDQLLYPDDDGKPMSDNTLQFQWIVTIEGCLEGMFIHDDNVFVAGDLLWYAVEGEPRIRTAPDIMVAFGRPKGYRGSYKQWLEGGIAPQVVFEILSPGNRKGEMAKKFKFYERHGVEEYYLYDPNNIELTGFRLVDGKLVAIQVMDGWISPRLGIRFDMSGPELIIWQPNGERFLTSLERVQLQEKETRRAEQQQEQAQQERQRAEQQQERAEQERQRAEQERQRAEQQQEQAEQERRRAEHLAARLRELGIDPDSIH